MPLVAPSPSSLAHRESVARILTPLRRARPTVAYYKLAAHRIPTLWTLYRGLLRNAGRENLKWRIRTRFEAKKHTIQAHVAKTQLERAYEWLDVFVRAKQGDTYLQAVLDRYDRMIASKRERRAFGRLVREALDEQARLHNRVVFKGSFIRPTFYNRLLPRLVPQPVSISCMIHQRRLRRERTYGESERLTEWIKDLERESAFEQELVRAGECVQPVFSDDLNAWLQPLRDKRRIMQAANERDYTRLYSSYPSRLLLEGLDARRHKIRYKTRQHARERSGEVFPTTLARMRQGPPAHVLANMTPEQRRADKAVRGPSEGGFSAAVKIATGMRLKDNETWKAEGGKETDQVRLAKLEEDVRKENARRRGTAESRGGVDSMTSRA